MVHIFSVVQKLSTETEGSNTAFLSILDTTTTQKFARTITADTLFILGARVRLSVSVTKTFFEKDAQKKESKWKLKILFFLTGLFLIAENEIFALFVAKTVGSEFFSDTDKPFFRFRAVQADVVPVLILRVFKLDTFKFKAGV